MGSSEPSTGKGVVLRAVPGLPGCDNSSPNNAQREVCKLVHVKSKIASVETRDGRGTLPRVAKAHPFVQWESLHALGRDGAKDVRLTETAEPLFTVIAE
jgi:hypothetical protein